MSDLVWVCPQRYLHSEDEWKSTVKKSGYIPILRADLGKFQESLQKTLKNKQLASNNISVGPNKETISTFGGGTNELRGDLTSKYKPIDEFLQNNTPLTTFSIRSINYIDSTDKIETLLTKWIDYLKDYLKDTIDKNVLKLNSWSRIFATGFETQDIFVQMSIKNSDYSKFHQFLALFESLGNHSSKFSINFDESLTKLISSKLANKEYDESTYAALLQHMEQKLEEYVINGSSSNKMNNPQSKNLTTDEYQIDLSTLSDLPRESLGQLCKDIREFRSRVITIEREKMLKDSIEENQRRRQKMVQMFEDTHKKQNMNKTPINNILTTDGDDGDAFSYPDDSHVNEDDDGYSAEQKRVEKDNIEAKTRYKKLLHKLNSTIELRLKTLENKLAKAENYNTALLEIQPVSIKELLHLGEDAYYDSNRSFRISEEQLDDLNRKKYGSDVVIPPLASELSKKLSNTTSTDVDVKTKHTAATAASLQSRESDNAAAINITINFNKASGKEKEDEDNQEAMEQIPINETSNYPTNLNNNASSSNMHIVLPFGDQELDNKIRRLKESKLVDKLIKEYLGVYEEELVDYIFDNIKEFKNKNTLLEELKETFDEDAVIIVDKIWNSEELSS